MDGCPTFAPAYVGRKIWAQPNNRLLLNPIGERQPIPAKGVIDDLSRREAQSLLPLSHPFSRGSLFL
jgi:hypothetical protein